MSKRAICTPFTSPLEEEVGAKRREGGEPQTRKSVITPLPNPPPQRGRERSTDAAPLQGRT
jgi:hypothetical protein